MVDAPRMAVRVVNASSDQQRGARDEERRTIKERAITGEQNVRYTGNENVRI